MEIHSKKLVNEMKILIENINTMDKMEIMVEAN